MKRLHAIAEMDSVSLEHLKKDKDAFITMCLEEIYFITGRLEAFEEVFEILHGNKKGEK